jgi:hypothetical protein
VVDAVDNVARAWPNVADELVFKAHKSFARHAATGRASGGAQAGQQTR